MDTIANMLTTLINAQRVRKQRVVVPYSRYKENLARLLQEKGYVADLRVQDGPQPKIIITLAYTEAGQPKIQGVRRLSRPGQRRYANRSEIPFVRDGLGSILLSTSQGLVDDTRARKLGIGGELVCEIW
jgi:small subunit ribosomal protein S8